MQFNPTERRCFFFAMPDNPENYDTHDAYRRSPGIDRARLLREATTAFLDTLPGNAMAARQYAILADGFLPQIARDDAIAVARMLASRLPLPDIIQSAFRRNGIGFRHQDLFSQLADEAAMIAENRFFAGPLMDAAEKQATPKTNLDHLDPYGLHKSGIDPTTLLSLTRATDREDIHDFTALVTSLLSRSHARPSSEMILRLLQDHTGEPAALLISAIGGDQDLLARALFAFSADQKELVRRARNAAAYFERLEPASSLQLIAQYFGMPVRPADSSAQHVTVQSGQSLRLRATAPASQPAIKRPLSERLGNAARK